MSSLNGLVFPINALPCCRLVEEGIDRISRDADVKYEATLRYYERVDADLLFYFNDVAIQAEPMGARVRFSADSMPCVMESAREASAPNPSHTPRMKVNARVLRRLAQTFPHKLKAGLVYGPFTVAGQIAGERHVLRQTIDNPAELERLLDMTLEFSRDYGRFLLDAGADVLWVSDPFAALLPPDRFTQFAGDRLASLFTDCSALTALHICGDTTRIVEEMVRTGVKGISFDQCMNLLALEDDIPQNVTIIGNLDPVEVVELMGLEEVTEHTADLVSVMGIKSNFALSTGCALPISTPIDNAAAFVNEGRLRLASISPHARQLSFLAEAVHEGNRDAAPDLVDSALQSGISAQSIIGSALMRAVRKASARYELKDCFLPEILLVVDAFYQGYRQLESRVGTNGNVAPQVALGTVKGDFHEIGKDLVRIMLEANGIRVMDLGVDVDGARFTEAADSYGISVVGLSAFTTTARRQLFRIIERFRQEGLSHIPIVVGGAAVNEQIAAAAGASGYGRDALEAVKLIGRILKSSGA